MAIRLEDLLATFRRHLRAAAKAPRTIELYSRSVPYFSRWLTDRAREPPVLLRLRPEGRWHARNDLLIRRGVEHQHPNQLGVQVASGSQRSTCVATSPARVS